MAGHLRETFPVLENLATGEGEVLHTAVDAAAIASKNGLKAFAFQTSDGKFVLPTLTAEGKLPVDFEGAGIAKKASSDGEIAGALTLTTICEISLTADKTYGKVMAQGSCFKEAIFYLVHVDDSTETIVGHAIVGAGDYNGKIDLGIAELVAGSTGTQKLVLKAKNLVKLSDFLGHVSCLEFSA
jgi:hypothetical protein